MVSLVLDPNYEPEVINVMRHILKPGDCAIDGGANLGFFSLMMGAIVGDEGSVLAFEPEEENLIKLHKHLATTKLPVKVIPQALWDKCGKATLHLAVGDGCHSLSPLLYTIEGGYGDDTIGKQEVETTTIDTWNVAPRLIKLDIEGAELNALMGGVETISRHRPYIICELNPSALARFGRAGNEIRYFAKEKFGYELFILPGKDTYPIHLLDGVEIATRYSINVLLATADMVAKAFPVISCEVVHV